MVGLDTDSHTVLKNHLRTRAFEDGILYREAATCCNPSQLSSMRL